MIDRTFTAEQVNGLLFMLGHASAGGEQRATLREREEHPDHGWIEVEGPAVTYAMWKRTGAVHRLNPDGAVSDEPIWPRR